MHVPSMIKSAQATLLVAACVCLSGCSTVATLQDWHFCCTNKYRASEAWKCTFSPEDRKCLSCDFETGFKKGYFDTVMNRDCRLPPVAPPKYWAARYQSCEGQLQVQEWFKGYQHGIAAAQSTDLPGSAEVPVSPGAPIVNKTGCGACYSPNNCRCQPHSADSSAGEFGSIDAPPVIAPIATPSDWSPSNDLPIRDKVEKGMNEAYESTKPSYELPLPVKESEGSSKVQPKGSSRVFHPVSLGSTNGLIGGFGNLNFNN